MRVTAMESENLAMDAIDVFTSIIDAIRKRVRLALAQGSLGILCVSLLYARRVLRQVSNAVSAADVRSEEDRRLLREIAEDLQRFADTMDSCRDQLADSRNLFSVVVVRLVDALVVKAEDVAETAALGACLEFANLVKDDLKGHDTVRVVPERRIVLTP